MNTGKTVVPCPQCGKYVLFDIKVSPFRPFCSERCKLIDLGQWANAGYSIPVKDDAPQILLDPDESSS